MTSVVRFIKEAELGSVFDDQATKAMGDAFEAACKALDEAEQCVVKDGHRLGAAGQPQRQLTIPADMAINEIFQLSRRAMSFKAEATQDFLRDSVRNSIVLFAQSAV